LDRRTVQVQLADRTTQRAVDLSENIAAKTALQKAGRELGIKLLKHFDEHLPKAAEHQVILQLNQNRLTALGLSARQVIDALRDRNPHIEMSARMEQAEGLLKVRVSGSAERLAQLDKTIISAPDQPLVRVADVAEITNVDSEQKQGE
jgi:predicted hydrocarbon binding protein